MGKPRPKPESSLYERDFYAWTQDQAAKLRARAHNEIDWENAAEEIEGLGGSEEDEIGSRLNVLLVHLLKWRYQPTNRSSGWRGTIMEQRYRLARRLKRSPSLKDFPGEVLSHEYATARLYAAEETGLPEHVFPEDCPFEIGQILDNSFWPEAA